MNKKILIFISLVFVFTFIFAISVCAESYTVTYYDGNTEKEVVSTEGNGQVTLRETGYVSEENNKKLLGWFTYEGDMYKPGETITLSGNTKLYQFFGFEVTQKYFTTTESQWGWTYIQLQEDIVIESTMSINDGGRLYIDLNGHTITSTANNMFDQRRAGLIIVGEGNVIHEGSGAVFRSDYHFYDPNKACMYVGKNVNLKTNGAVYNPTSIGADSLTAVPFEIYGNVTCNQLLKVNSSIADNLKIVLNPKILKVTGDKLFNIGTHPQDALVEVLILGGNYELTESANNISYWNNDNKASFVFNISGGSFNNGEEFITENVIDGYTTVNSGAYITVVIAGECTHEYEVTSEQASSCITFASTTYTCKNCQDTYTVSYGEYSEHKWVLINETPPTLTTVGEKVYQCSVCQKIKSENQYVDILEEYIIVTVNTDDKEKEVSVKIKDVFDLESINTNEYRLKGLKDFDAYLSSSIISIKVPLGIVDINFASDNKTLKKLVIGDGAVVNVTSFSKCSALTHIEIGAASVKFVKGCSNNVIESIKSEVSGAEVIFDSQVFDGKTSVKELKLSSYSKYTFGGNSFRYANITEFIAPDYSDVTFKNEAAFYKCNSLKYIYIGRGIDVLAGKAFDYCQYVQTIVLMDVNTITMEYTFCVEDSGEKPVEVYIHSTSISLPNNTFHKCHGVTIYTNAPITNGSAFSNCNEVTKNGVYYPAYTIVYGIGHKLIEAHENPTCTENGINGYKADCPCGEDLDGSLTVQVFESAVTNSQSYNTITYVSTVIPATGHFEGEVVYVDYIDGYMVKGLKDCICRVCNEEYTELVPSADPLFVFLGYSMPEDGRLEITMGFMINNEAINTYDRLSENTFNYGVVLALENKLNGKAPLDSEVVSFTQKAELDRKYCGFDLKVSGFTDANKDLAVVMAIYVTEGDTTVYLQDLQTNLPTGVSINSLNS